FAPMGDEEGWNLQGLVDYLNGNLFNEGSITVNDLDGKDELELVEFILAKVKEGYDQKEEELSEEQMREFEKVIVLRAVDSKWMDHIDA
ncbi:preprotein translocase subunit SecA, partial [Bacillus sp. SIMBA_069]